ncbi:MAG: methyltransferase domain-containing protein [Lachnospiraceae bacterium]
MTNKSETIGKITLDYTYYPGEDFYCDGTVEDELLDIVKQYEPKEYRKVIEERAQWPILYHLSPQRENIVDWIPLDPALKVLEVGSGCGAITGALARKSGSVTCVDLSKKRSLINAYRHQECQNVEIKVGNFTDIEPTLPSDYDYIFLIGVFEYGQSYIGGEHPYEEFLTILQRHLNVGGRIVIAIENRLGLKYFAGCKEDHLGNYFSGIEDYAQGGGVRTFTKNRLEQLLHTHQIKEYSFYYPYPDYKFMSTVYSDEYLPHIGELSTNIRNFDRDRMLLFDEKDAFDGMIRDQLFPIFSNSYVVMIGEPIAVKYAKFSNDRAKSFEIRTDISKNEDGSYEVKKIPLSEEAGTHISHIETAYDMLCRRYAGSRLELNKCIRDNDGLRFEYVNGVTLETLLDECLDRENIEAFLSLFRQYVDTIDYCNSTEPLEHIATDYDLIFSNILVQGDKWVVIDYEWTFAQHIPTAEVAYRAFYCYTLGAEKRRKINKDLIFDALGITKQRAEELEQQEKRFQAYVTGKDVSLGDIRHKIGYEIWSPFDLQSKYSEEADKRRIQIYEDKGNGFCEQDSYLISDAYVAEDRVAFARNITKDVSSIRLDPAMERCMVSIEQLTFNGVSLPLKGKKCITNGVLCAPGTYVFATTDPNIVLNLQGIPRTDRDRLQVTMSVSRITAHTAEAFSRKRGVLRHATDD